MCSVSGLFLPCALRGLIPFWSRGPGYTGVRVDSITPSAAALQSIRSKCVISQNGICTYCATLLCALEVLRDPPTLWPRHAICGYFPDIECASCMVDLSPGLVWLSDAGQSFSYTRNLGTVKATYWGHIFFCYCFIAGVSRCLGWPSGGVGGWLGHVRDERRHQG